MTHVIKALSALLSLAAGIASCTAPIELETNDSAPVIVIYGVLTEYVMYQTVRLSGSSPYFEEKQNQPVSDAEMTIQASDGRTFEMEEIPHEKGIYQTLTPMSALPGITYRLIVRVDFDGDGQIETYEASTTMPAPFHIDSITVTPMDFMGYKHYAINLYAPEEPQEDFYLTRYIVNDTLADYQISSYSVFSDNAINNQYINGMSLMYFDDVANRNNGIVEEEGWTYVQSGDKITVCISRIEEGYYDFVRQCQSEKRGENPFFGGPASNIATNIRPGGAGYFAAFTTTITDVYIP
ncbi:MAG: DUF4249 domain-containing protein [Tannerella sp.]|jgi:hypothetical protein|nr:DUF4249 domain-containing protein [Tannerella sp.]